MKVNVLSHCLLREAIVEKGEGGGEGEGSIERERELWAKKKKLRERERDTEWGCQYWYVLIWIY